MKRFILHGEDDVRALRAFRRQPGVRQTIVDFDEQILLASIRAAM